MESCGCYDHAADKVNTLDDTKPKQPNAGLIFQVGIMDRYLKQVRYSESLVKKLQSSWQQSSNTSHAKSLNLHATLLRSME